MKTYFKINLYFYKKYKSKDSETDKCTQLAIYWTEKLCIVGDKEMAS